MLKVIVIGYGEMFASLISGAKFSNHKVVGAFRYDRVRYSKLALFFKDLLNPSYELSFIKSHKIKDINAPCVNSDEFIKEIKKLKADVVLVGSWGEKISPKSYNVPKFGFINCHPALLPKHRGANPYFWAIKMGDEKTGVTFHQINEKWDRGEILYQGSIKIEPYMNAKDLKTKACKVAEIMTGELLKDLEEGRLIPTPQNEDDSTYEYQITPEDLILDLTESVQNIKNHIRALTPNFKPLYRYEGKVYEIDGVEFLEDDKNCPAGSLIKEEGKFSFFKVKDGVMKILNY